MGCGNGAGHGGGAAGLTPRQLCNVVYAMHAPPPSTDAHQAWRDGLHEDLDPAVAEARRKVVAGLSNITRLGRG